MLNLLRLCFAAAWHAADLQFHIHIDSCAVVCERQYMLELHHNLDRPSACAAGWRSHCLAALLALHAQGPRFRPYCAGLLFSSLHTGVSCEGWGSSAAAQCEIAAGLMEVGAGCQDVMIGARNASWAWLPSMMAACVTNVCLPSEPLLHVCKIGWCLPRLHFA